MNSESNQELEQEQSGAPADQDLAAASAAELDAEAGPGTDAESPETSLDETTENLAEAAGALGLHGEDLDAVASDEAGDDSAEASAELAASTEEYEDGQPAESTDCAAPEASNEDACSDDEQPEPGPEQSSSYSAADSDEHDSDSAADSAEPDSDAAKAADSEVDQPDSEPEEELPELSEEEAGMLGKVLFALLFASPEPLSLGRLKDLTESPAAHVRTGLEALEEQLAGSELPLILRSIAGGYRLFSAPEVADVVTRLSKVRKAEQISPAALETLAIVAYRQPTTKAEVEAIRGVQAGPMLRGLIDRGLVKVTGRADQPGSPLQYGTTREFLDRFGLENLKALPRDNELAAK